MDQRAFAHETRLRYQDEIVQVMQDLVRLSSQNTPPVGEEKACQDYIANYLKRTGLSVDVYEPDQVAGLVEHPAFWPGRDYANRPNVSSVLSGQGGGRSLLLTGHCDTVPLGESVWTRPPFGAEIHAGRLYGLGSLDMKGSLGAMLVLFKAVAEGKLLLRGSLCFESVVDEEFGGVNGTLAGRFRHGPMDGAAIGEGTELQIHPAAKGLLISNLILKSTRGTFLEAGTAKEAGQRADVIEQIGIILAHLNELRARRRTHSVHPLYQTFPDPAPVEVTKVYAGGWGNQVPITVPSEGRIELILHTLPGEERADVLREQEEWLSDVVERNRAAFVTQPETQFHIRWMPPTAMDSAHPLVTTLADGVAQVIGRAPSIMGAPYACDLFALHQVFNMPALVFGPTGANAHAADEYVELESVFAFWESLLLFVMEWCGVE